MVSIGKAGIQKRLATTKTRVYGVAWLSWFFFLWYLSSGELPKVEDGPEIPFFDKILHFGYFGIGGALLAFIALSSWKVLNRALFILLLLIGMSVGVLDEWHQSWVEGRSGSDVGDFLADSVGTFAGIVCAKGVWRFFMK